nr:hypothetical protein CFP56_26984 [Quercus suber]
MITARDEELGAMKKGLEQAKHDNYDLGFDDIECSTTKVPLPEDPPVEEVPQGGQAKAKEDSPNFCELLEEIEVHTTNTDVIDVDNLSPLRTVQPIVALVRSEVAEASPDPTPPITEQSPNT